FPIYIFLMYYIQNYSVLMVVGIFVFGLIGFSMSPSLQFKSTIVSQDAPMLASTLNQSAFNIVNELGAAIADVVGSQLGTENLALVTPILTIIGLIFLILEQSLSKKRAFNTA